MTGKFLEAERKLGEPLAQWVQDHQNDGWAWLAIELSRLTGVMVGAEELAQWWTDLPRSVSYQVDPFKLCR